MGFLKVKGKFNWRYALGEILLIFIGINLAIWFNNWNSSKKSAHDKKIAIAKITEEIATNRIELNVAQQNNQLILLAYADYQEIYNGNTSEIISSPKKLSILQNKYPEFFSIKDSVKHHNGVFRYKGGTNIELELPTLTEIAWETTRALSVTNEFDYECLYDLESMYNLQRRVQIEINKAANALQRSELNELIRVLGFLNQLDVQLEEKYKEMLEHIDSCS